MAHLSKLKLLVAVLLAAMFAGGALAEAKYRSTEDAGASVLDYLENRRRTERENRPTPAQSALIADVLAMRGQLRQPIDPQKQLPLALEGDDLFYDQITGDVCAKGNVRVTEVDGRRVIADVVAGNLNAKTVRSDDAVQVVSVAPEQPRADLTGYRVVYNYGEKTGHLESAKGRVGHYYISGKRIELHPDKVLVYDGYETKCGAKSPDYRVSGDFIEIYPNKEAIIHRARVWIKGKVVYSRDLVKSDISEDAKDNMVLPRVGYDSDNGVWIGYKYKLPLASHVDAFANFRYYSRHGFRNIYGTEWQNAGSRLALEYGRYEDSDNRWIRKKPTLLYDYTNKIKPLNLNYHFGYERGRWSDRGIKSLHTAYSLYVNTDPLFLGSQSTRLNLGVGYKITDESYGDSRVDGFNYDATLVHEFGDAFAVYAGYSYDANNAQDSLFSFDLDDYPKKIVGGWSARLTDRDRILMATEWNAEKSNLRDVDWYWFHDMHCATAILKYRAKRDSWHFSLQFTPW